MSTANFIIDMLVFDDAEVTNDPQQCVLDYKKHIVATLPNSSVQSFSAPAGVTSISIPSNPKWLYIETDQTLQVRFNGSVEAFVLVSPSAAGQMDGVFFKRGAFTSLSLNNPGSTAANVKVFIGT